MFQGIFNYDNPVWRFIGRLADMMLLNVLWILCCLPIFTIGAATTALYYCTLKIARDEDNGIIRMFFKSFRLNFRQASLIWLIMLPAGIMLCADFYFFGNIMRGNATLRLVLRALTGALMLIWSFVFLYVWPLLARFENTVKKTLGNAVFMSLSFLGNTLAMLVSDAVLILLTYFSLFYFPMITPVLLLIGFPAIAWLNSTMFEHIFKRFMPKEKGEADEEPWPIPKETEAGAAEAETEGAKTLTQGAPDHGGSTEEKREP